MTILKVRKPFRLNYITTKRKQNDTKELIKTVIKATPKEVDEKKEIEEDTPDTGLMGKPKKEEK